MCASRESCADSRPITLDDLKNGTQHADVIGVGGASGGEHGPWQIPYGALVPEQVDNVLAAGRCVSAEIRMADLVRLIPNCFVTGQAAGVAAAVSVRRRLPATPCRCPAGATDPPRTGGLPRVTVQETHDAGREAPQCEQVVHRWRWTANHWRWAVSHWLGQTDRGADWQCHPALFAGEHDRLVALCAGSESAGVGRCGAWHAHDFADGCARTRGRDLGRLAEAVVLSLGLPDRLLRDGASWLGRKAGLRLPRIPVLGGALAILILAGACLGYPILLWTDPLALWSNAMGVGRAATGWAALVGMGAFVGILCVSVLWPHSWCTRICPLGGMQDWMARGKATLVPLTLPSREPHTKSTKERRVRSSQERVPRRVLIGGALGAAWGWSQIHTAASTERPLRPPGAAMENQFTSLCMRCGNCLRACPTGILSLASLQHGLAGWLSPVVTYDTDYCLESCNRMHDRLSKRGVELCPGGTETPGRNGCAASGHERLPAGR